MLQCAPMEQLQRYKKHWGKTELGSQGREDFQGGRYDSWYQKQLPAQEGGGRSTDPELCLGSSH